MAAGTTGNDTLNGTALADTLDGLEGDDLLQGYAGDDSLNGGAGNDDIYAHDGNDLLLGGAGADYLSDTNSGNDTLNGGIGNDTLFSYYGIDVIRYDLGGGYDKATLYYTAVGDGAVLELGAGINPGDVTLHHTNGSDDLILRFNGTDQFGVETWFTGGSVRQLSEIRFADSTVWTWAGNLSAMMVQTLGTAGNDYMSAPLSNDSVEGLGGDDTLYGNSGNDVLFGGTGNDAIIGHAGHDALFGGDGIDNLSDTASGSNDTFNGGTGDDSITSSYGIDVVRYDLGGGYDRVTLNYTSAGDGAVLELGAGLNPGDVTLHHTNGSYDLILRFNGSDRVGVEDWFYAASGQFKEIHFNDSTVWNPGIVAAMTVQTPGTVGNDYMSSPFSNDSVEGLDGNDTIDGNAGNDTLFGGAGNDSLTGDVGNDSLLGGAGIDILTDTASSNDTFSGGIGDDSITSYYGNDVVRYDLGGGIDRVSLYYTTAGDNAVLELGAGLNPGDVTLHHTNGSNDLVLRFNGSDQVIAEDWFYSGSTGQFSEIRFADSTVWTWAGNLAAMTVQTLGTVGNDYMSSPLSNDSVDGLDGNDSIDGNAGDDTLFGGAGNDTLDGDVGNDSLLGGDGIDILTDTASNNDTFSGGIGDDSITSYYGNDIVRYDLGGGVDRISLYYTTAGDNAVLELGAGLNPGDVTLHHTNGSNDLVLRFNGSDQVIAEDWFYSGSTGQFSEIRFADSTVWTWAGNMAAMTVQTLGTVGNDYMWSPLSNDSVDGLGGNDSLYGNAGNDTLNGGAGNDTLNGDDGNDSLLGGDGIDVLGDTASSNDTFSGGIGDDSITSYYGNDVVRYDLGGGVDRVSLYYTTAGDNAVLELGAGLNAGDVTLHHTNGSNDLILRFNGSDQVIAEDWFYSGSTGQFSEIRFADSTVWTWAGNLAAMTVQTLGTAGNDYMSVTIGNDSVDGLGGNDSLYGNAGNDTLNGGVGNDTVESHDGDDLLLGGSGADLLRDYNSGNDTFNGGIGNDTISANFGVDIVQYNVGGGSDRVELYYGSAGEGAVLELGAGILAADVVLSHTLGTYNLVLGFNAADSVVVADWLYSDSYRFDEIRFDDGTVWTWSAGSMFSLAINTTGSAASDGLYMTSARDSVVGLGGDDYLYGYDGNDSLDGGAGADLLDGGIGDDSLIGGGASDQVYGREGNDTLDGGLGSNYLEGGAGNDVYVVSSLTDTLYEYSAEGSDTVRASVAYTLIDNFEHLVLTGAEGLAGSGNALANSLTGNGANNLLQGMGGVDTLIGNAGADTLDGGNGADSMVGGSGDDVYVVNLSTDILVEAVSAGVDTVRTALSYTLAANFENIELTGAAAGSATGTALANTLWGNSGNNLLKGMEGNDTLFGGDGNDTLNGGDGADSLAGGFGDDRYYVASATDVVEEAVGAGSDTVQSTTSWTLAANLESLLLTGTAALTGSGNGEANLLTGNSGNNLLQGRVGNDTLDGGAGADTLEGGVGSDSYFVDSIADVIVEGNSSEIDLVTASVDFTLGNYVDSLVLTGSAALSGTGNGLANSITGNAANNLLVGMSGNDTLIGRAGNDTLDGGWGNDSLAGGLGDDTYMVNVVEDVVVEDVAAGIDTVRSQISFTLGDNFEWLLLTGEGNIDGTGHAGNNLINGWLGANLLSGKLGDDTLIGSSGNDTLNGGLGNDSMAGGADDDLYYVDSAADVLVEVGAEGVDTVSAAISFTLGEEFEHLVLSGTSGLAGSGNWLNNSVTGNSGANLLNGKGGADTLNGAGGNDTLAGNAGNDLLVGGAGADRFLFNIAPNATTNLDTIAGFGATDILQLDGAVFSALAVGVLAAGRFVVGAAAADTGDRVIYDQATGTLYYDIDGTGASAQVAFAVVDNREALLASQFEVV